MTRYTNTTSTGFSISSCLSTNTKKVRPASNADNDSYTLFESEDPFQASNSQEQGFIFRQEGELHEAIEVTHEDWMYRDGRPQLVQSVLEMFDNAKTRTLADLQSGSGLMHSIDLDQLLADAQAELNRWTNPVAQDHIDRFNNQVALKGKLGSSAELLSKVAHGPRTLEERIAQQSRTMESFQDAGEPADPELGENGTSQLLGRLWDALTKGLDGNSDNEAYALGGLLLAVVTGGTAGIVAGAAAMADYVANEWSSGAAIPAGDVTGEKIDYKNNQGPWYEPGDAAKHNTLRLANAIFNFTDPSSAFYYLSTQAIDTIKKTDPLRRPVEGGDIDPEIVEGFMKWIGGLSGKPDAPKDPNDLISNWGPDGKPMDIGREVESIISYTNRLDPIINWGPNGRPQLVSEEEMRAWKESRQREAMNGDPTIINPGTQYDSFASSTGGESSLSQQDDDSDSGSLTTGISENDSAKIV